VLFVLAVVTSQWRKFFRIEYGVWRYAHVALATLGYVAATAHVLGIGKHTSSPGKAALWFALTLFWLLLLVWVRLAKPYRQSRLPYRVVEVRPEFGGDTWTVALEPEGHAGLRRFKPGQFAWLTLRSSPYRLREHPFSIASAPEQLPRLEFGIKALGDFTALIGDVKPGETAYLDAPYGVFSVDNHPDASGFVFVVGGIGVTPAISMLRSLAARGESRPLWLLYGNKRWDEVIYREEIDTLQLRLNLSVVHILEEAPADWPGETGFVTKDMLERHMPPDRSRLSCFLCGPTPMTATAREGLHHLGVPRARIRTEIFELA
jgi:predicted ferric reductase